MLVMTAKIDKKKIAIVLGAIAALIAIVLLLGGKDRAGAEPTAAISGNDERLAFLSGFGWEADASPTQSGQVRIPETTSEVFDRYNALQKSQGYDLTTYAGQTVMRYVYQIRNYPGSTEPVYATLLIHQNQVIGGDITDTSLKGQIRGFSQPLSQTQPEPTTPETT